MYTKQNHIVALTIFGRKTFSFFFPLFFFHIFLSPYDPIVCTELTTLYQISYSSLGPSDPSPIKVKGDVVRYSMKTEF